MVIVEPTSSVLVSVNEPATEPTLVPEQYITAFAAMVALLPAAERLPSTVAFDFVPFPVGSKPLLPGPAANVVAGAATATASIAATASQPNLRRPCPSRAERGVKVVMLVSPSGIETDVDRLGIDAITVAC